MSIVSFMPSRQVNVARRAPGLRVRQQPGRIAPRLDRTRIVVCRAEPEQIEDSLQDELGDLAAKIEELSKTVDEGLQVRSRSGSHLA